MCTRVRGRLEEKLIASDRIRKTAQSDGDGNGSSAGAVGGSVEQRNAHNALVTSHQNLYDRWRHEDITFMNAVDELRRRRALTEARSLLSDVLGTSARAVVDGDDAAAAVATRFHAHIVPRIAACGVEWDDICALALAMRQRYTGLAAVRQIGGAPEHAEAALRRVVNGVAVSAVGRSASSYSISHTSLDVERRTFGCVSATQNSAVVTACSRAGWTRYIQPALEVLRVENADAKRCNLKPPCVPLHSTTA